MADNLKLEIINYLNKHNQIYVEITDDKSMEIIHNLLLVMNPFSWMSY